MNNKFMFCQNLKTYVFICMYLSGPHGNKLSVLVISVLGCPVGFGDIKTHCGWSVCEGVIY